MYNSVECPRIVLATQYVKSKFVSLTYLPLSVSSLYNNSIGDEGAMALSETVKEMPNLQVLQ